MATLISLNVADEKFQDYFARIFQSSNVNFLFGAGASSPAITVAGDIESRIQEQYDASNDAGAEKIEYSLLKNIQYSTVALSGSESNVITGDVGGVLARYCDFIGIVELMLQRRHSNLLAKKVNIFTTNYDLFVEKSALKHRGLVLNDGFQVRSSLSNEYRYDARGFSRTFFESSALYDYKVELPVVNLIKMHGSMSWTMDSDDADEIKFKVNSASLPDESELSKEQVKSKLDEYYLIYPKKEKFKTTLLNHTYYDLMRIYSNELDKEQTTLIAFGFSFLDEHILDLTKRALRNSTLKLVIFAYDDSVKLRLSLLFSGYNNVDIIHSPNGELLKFEQFNQAMGCYAFSGEAYAS